MAPEALKDLTKPGAIFSQEDEAPNCSVRLPQRVDTPKTPVAVQELLAHHEAVAAKSLAAGGNALGGSKATVPAEPSGESEEAKKKRLAKEKREKTQKEKQAAKEAWEKTILGQMTNLSLRVQKDAETARRLGNGLSPFPLAAPHVKDCRTVATQLDEKFEQLQKLVTDKVEDEEQYAPIKKWLDEKFQHHTGVLDLAATTHKHMTKPTAGTKGDGKAGAKAKAKAKSAASGGVQ